MSLTITTTRRDQPLHVIAFGPPGRAKTELGISMSDHCPSNFSNLIVKGANRIQPQPVELKDLLVVAFEPSATIGWGQRNITAPDLDMSALDPYAYQPTDAKGFFQNFRDAHKLIAERVKSGETKYVMLDGPTFLDGLLQEAVSYFHSRLDGPQFWGQVQQYHRDWVLPLMRIPAAMMLHIMHADSKPADMGGKSEAAQANAEAQALKRKAWGVGDISPKLSGGAKAVYRGVASLILYVDRGTQMVGSPPKAADGYWMQAEAAQYDAKSRFELDAVLPADMRAVKAKIAAREAAAAKAAF